MLYYFCLREARQLRVEVRTVGNITNRVADPEPDPDLSAGSGSGSFPPDPNPGSGTFPGYKKLYNNIICKLSFFIF